MDNFFKHKHLFDCSNFSKDSKFHDNQNEMVVGKMKDECKGIPINRFVELKSKMHCMLSDDGEEFNTAKGVNIATEFKEYGDYLINKIVIRHKLRKFKVKNIKLDRMKSSRYHYCVFDDKRFVLDDGIHMLAYFHKDLKKIDSHR